MYALAAPDTGEVTVHSTEEYQVTAKAACGGDSGPLFDDIVAPMATNPGPRTLSRLLASMAWR